MDFSFKTDKFNVTEAETEISGEYKYGKELCDFLISELKLKKQLDGKTQKYEKISVHVEKDVGWFITIDDNFFEVEINIINELFEVKMKEDKTPENVLDITWSIFPNVYISLLSYKTYYNMVMRTDIFDTYYNQLSMDLESIARDSNFKLVRVLR